MKNAIEIKKIELKNNKIIYSYDIHGEWQEVFSNQREMYIEYKSDISKVPESVLVIPFLANILPIAWVCDAEILVPECDRDFYDSIEDFKNGYKNMYPMMDFKGIINAVQIVENQIENQNGVAAFFSGGVDAFNTLTQHADEKPTLITLWGADVHLDDELGWEKVNNHIDATARDFGIDYVVVKSCFRIFINENKLTERVKKSGDGWWHGFQHGIGIISHAAPIMYAKGEKTVYFASSFTAAEKGKVTCASDPTIDNYVRFCGVNVIHDGYEFNRQMKVHNITKYSNKTKRQIPLRVCWESLGGSNCCKCEKCWRTMLGIYAEGYDPHDYGFEFDKKQLKKVAIKMHYSDSKMFTSLRYKPIQDAMRTHTKKQELPNEIKWFYDVDINKIGQGKIWFKAIRKIKHVLVGYR